MGVLIVSGYFVDKTCAKLVKTLLNRVKTIVDGDLNRPEDAKIGSLLLHKVPRKTKVGRTDKAPKKVWFNKKSNNPKPQFVHSAENISHKHDGLKR